jgi:hypothetical protein
MPGLVVQYANMVSPSNPLAVFATAEAVSIVAQLKSHGSFGGGSPGFNEAAQAGYFSAKKLLAGSLVP